MRKVLLLALLSSIAFGQWVKEPARGVPRTKDGKPNLTAPAPRTNGKPDFTGIWQTDDEKPGVIEKLAPGIGLNEVPGDRPTTFTRFLFNAMVDYPENDIKMTPPAQRLFEENLKTGDSVGPKCLPSGLPMAELFPSPRRVVQTKDMVIVIYEGEVPRQIHMDGRLLPRDPQPAWMGYSVAKWDGDALLVETVGLHPRSPIDAFGHPRSESMKLKERWRRPDYGHLTVDLTIEDPAYYSKPISYRFQSTLVPDDDMLEWICTENEKDGAHIK